jgi:hypothetical protein
MSRTAMAAATLSAVVAVLALSPRPAGPEQARPTAAQIHAAAALAAADVPARQR